MENEIVQVLLESKSVEEARKRLYDNLNDLELRYGYSDMKPMDYRIAREAVGVFRNILSPRNERMAGFSTLRLLHDYYHSGDSEDSGDKAGDGFIEEFEHLYIAIYGSTGYPEGWLWPIMKREGLEPVDFSVVKGRKAAEMRSDLLDKIGEKIFEYIKRYPSGLDARIIEKREENRRRILKFLGADIGV